MRKMSFASSYRLSRAQTTRINGIILLLSSLLFALTGCGPEGPSVPISQVQQAIGYGNNDSSNLFPAVVFVGGAQTGCTGTFIAPNFILTAAHCFKCA